MTITIETTGTGELSPGFHGVHIHSAGKCEANSTAPTGGAPGDFLSAGGHFMANGEHGSGDLTSLQVRKDGGGLLETTTDGFTKADLLAGAGTSIVIHASTNNSATSRQTAITRSTAARPTRRRCRLATPASGFLAV